jgi:putative peptidoglycan lipid II flippase
MLGTLGSRLSGFVRQSLLTQLFRAEITDAFIVALRVPNLFRELLAEGALTNSFVPIYKSLSKDEARRLSSALLGLLVVVNSLVLIAAYVLAPWIVHLLLLGDGNVNEALTLELVRIVFPFLFAISLSAWAMGILNAEERFFAPAWAPVALNGVASVLMLLYPDEAPMLAWGFVLGGLAQFVVQLPAVIRGAFVSQLGRIWHPGLANVLTLMLPSVFTTSGRQVLNLVASNVLNLLPPGSNTAFQNAELFLSLALGLFSISPALSYYSRLSSNASDDPGLFPVTLLAGLRFITFLTVPAGLLLSVLAVPAVELVFNWFTLLGRPGASAAILNATVLVLIPLGLAIFPVGLNNLLIRIFYIRQKITTPIVVSVSALTLQGALYFTLSQTPLGIEGLSWATVIMGWTQFLVLMILVARQERFAPADFARYALKVWLAASLAALASYGALGLLPAATQYLDYLLQALVGAGVFGATYGGLCLGLRLPELEQLLRRVRRVKRS